MIKNVIIEFEKEIYRYTTDGKSEGFVVHSIKRLFNTNGVFRSLEVEFKDGSFKYYRNCVYVEYY